MAKRYIPISDLGEIVTGKTPPTANGELWGGSIPFITPTDIKGFSSFYQGETERTVSDIGANKQKKTLLPKNSVCVSCIATIGKMCLTSTESITNQQINTIVPNKNYDHRYVLYLLRYNLPYIQLVGGGSGSGTPIISKSKFAKFTFLIEDSLPTQQKIASILSAYDSQIENNQKRIKLLEQMAENLYKEWFVRFRFPGYENAEFEGGMPKGWTRCKLGDLIDFQNGFAFKSETFVPEGKYKVITIKNVQDGQFDSSNADRVEDIPKGMPSYCKLSEGDILLSLTGNVGRVCHVIGDNMLLNQRVAKIKSSHSHFAYCMLRTPAMFAYLNMIAYGTAQLNLSPIKAANLKIIKPTESIMEAFDKVVAPLFSSVFNLYNQIDFLSSQRDLLLPRLMSGKLSI